MTHRLPAALKKRLQANLENLTAKEAGRLLLIYMQEAEKKDPTWGKNGYPPIRELWGAFDNRVAKSRGKPEEAEVVNTYNGLVFLDRLIGEINFGDFLGLAIAFSADCYRVMTQVGMLLREDSTTQLIRFIRSGLVGDAPKPVSPDYHARYMSRLSNELDALTDAANWILAAKVEAGEIDEEKDGDEEFDRLYGALVAALRAGELEGGDALAHPDIFSPVLVEKGKLPAWAALRILWKPYLVDKGYRIADDQTFADWAPDFIDLVYTPAGELVRDEALRRLAGDFYKACRRRPWGKGLVAKPDLDNLVKLLTQSPNPFLHIFPADFGLISWEAFQQSERNRRTYYKGEELFELDPAATVASLTAISGKIWKDLSFDKDWNEGRYYPTSSPEGRRQDLARTLEMMQQLDTSRQPFTYGWLQKTRDEMSLSELLGVNFLTPLEETVANLRQQNNFAVSLRQALKIITDRYFEGLPVLIGNTEEPLTKGEDSLKLANEALKRWIKRLSVWPWQIDTASLEVDDPEIDDELVETIVERMMSGAKRDSRIANPEALFGEK